ncbi:MAG: electron transfer flavoprotein subunit beta/FixA family protein [Deltaproteobacteria bacterium]|nr:electron transfer flavoprotein subunit beta/FixA family protein [Deltaproteobacteria bacterium]
MNIIVCLKRVPDTTARIEIEKDGLDIKTDLPWILNPYDEFAVEEAIRIKERFGGKVTLVTAGAGGGEEILRKGVAMGADSAVYVKDPLLNGLEGIGAARVLSALIREVLFDLVLCGKRGTDADSGVVGPAIATLLNIPLVTAVKKLDIFPEERRAEALRETEEGAEAVECPMPAVFTAEKGLNEPRYPSLTGIMKAKKAEIKYIDLNSLGVGPDLFKDTLKREGLSYPQVKRKGVILNGDIAEQVKEAVKFLKTEVKVI